MKANEPDAKAAYGSPPAPPTERAAPRGPLASPTRGYCKRNPPERTQQNAMLNYPTMTNFDRILSEARELLTEAEQRRLSVELMPAAADDMDAEERAALDKAIEEGFEDFDKGDYSDARTFAKQLLARP